MIAPEKSSARFQYNMLWLPANSFDDPAEAGIRKVGC